MWLTKIFTVVTVAVTGLLPSSCSSAKNKTATAQTHGLADASVTSTNRNLGALALTNDYETCVDLGAGKSCTITPKVTGHSDLQLLMSLETKKANGKTDGISVTRVAASQGKTFEIALGDMNLTLTPNVVR